MSPNFLVNNHMLAQQMGLKKTLSAKEASASRFLCMRHFMVLQSILVFKLLAAGRKVTDIAVTVVVRFQMLIQLCIQSEYFIAIFDRANFALISVDYLMVFQPILAFEGFVACVTLIDVILEGSQISI